MNQSSQDLWVFLVLCFISLLSLLASSVKSWLLQTLKASSTKVDSRAWGSASSFYKLFQISGGAWVIRCMVNSDLFSVNSESVLMFFLNASDTWLRKTAGLSSFFLCNFLYKSYHDLYTSPNTFSFFLKNK